MKDNFVISRCENVETLLHVKSEYLAEIEKLDNLISEFDVTLNDKQKILFDRILSCKNAQSAMSNEACYYRGFSDCIKVVAYGELD